MIETIIGVVAGGALLGLIWMLATTPVVVVIRSGNGSAHPRGRDVRDAWIIAYSAGVLTYLALLVSGAIAY